MTLFLAVFIGLIAFISVGFCAFSNWRLYHYIKAYRFGRANYTLLFGFIPLKAIAIIYIFSTVIIALVSTSSFIYLQI